MGKQGWVQEVQNEAGYDAASNDISRIPTWSGVINYKGELNVTE